MFDKLGVKILGLVDNMSYFTGDDGKNIKYLVKAELSVLLKSLKKNF